MTPIIPAARARMRRTIQTGIAAIFVATALGCSGGDSTGPSNQNPVGPYGLFQINQKKVPAEIFRFPGGPTSDDVVMTVTGGELILQDDGEIHVAIDYQFSTEGRVVRGTDAEDGSYEIQGNQIVISSARGGGITGSYRNGTITLPLDVAGFGEHLTYTFRHAR
jgi:hypothetical protein